MLAPVASSALGYATPEETADLPAHWPSMLTSDLEELRGIPWWIQTNPVNARFLDSLRLASRGIHSNQV